MLEELRITSLGVIEESVLELGPGFTAITGETGAGKTMVVTALGLLLGGRADAGVVRSGARQARVEGLVSAGPALAARVEELGGHVEDGAVLLARQLAAEGRSRAYVGGVSVPVGVLAEQADALVAVHGQSDQHRLTHTPPQREALDAFAGLTGEREELTRVYRELRTVETELGELRDSARERAREADLLRFGLSEIGAVAPSPGEDDTLADEESRLAHADALRAAAESARQCLSADATIDGGRDALGAVAAARKQLEGVRAHDSVAADLADRLAEISYLLADLAADTAAYADGLETDPGRLAAVSERRAALQGLTRKYGATIADVLAWAEDAAARLTGLDTADERIGELDARCRELEAELADRGARLSEGRRAAAGRLADLVTAELAQLAMPHARLQVDVRRAERIGPSGLDEVDFLLAANAGAEPRPLGKGASGGELSRVMLGLEVVLAESNPVPTFVFDEVDAGIGGRAAVEVGRRLAALAKHAQVIVVTHLPQVAAYADRHVVVQKSDDGSITSSGLTALDEAGRVRELSRMLAGQESSASAQAHARELLESARSASS